MALEELTVSPVRNWPAGERDRPQSYQLTAANLAQGWDTVMLVMEGPDQYLNQRSIEWIIEIGDNNNGPWRDFASTLFETGSIPRFVVRRMLISLSAALQDKYFSIRTISGGGPLRYGITAYLGTAAEIDAKLTELVLTAPLP